MGAGRWTIKRGRKRADAPSDSHQRQAEIAVPGFGYNNHIGIDRAFGFLRRYTVTPAAAYDGGQLGAVLDRDNTASDVWADTAYSSAANLALIERRGLGPQFQRKKPRGKRMPAHIARGNATRAPVRSRVEHVFAAQKCRLGLLIRTLGIMRAGSKSAWLIWPTTSTDWPGSMGGPRRRDPTIPLQPGCHRQIRNRRPA
jgi:transposase, IS5 family